MTSLLLKGGRVVDPAQGLDDALDVRIVDLDMPDAQAPAGIVAIPAYVLDGRLLFTGNPTPWALFAALGQDTEIGG